MFTGIIESLGIVKAVSVEGTNKTYTVQAPITHELKVDQSLAHNGVCLTVTSISGETYTVTAVQETLEKTNLNDWKPGTLINLERAMIAGGRLDGHFVQGHVDCTGKCEAIEQREGSALIHFSFPARFATLIIEKGSICINGVSLTVFDVQKTTFAVTIIPYTMEHTNFSQLQAGDAVNLEFDVLGKYILRFNELNA